MGTLLGELGLHRSDLDDPDTLIPCAVTGALFERAQLMRPLKNLWTRLAAETPLGAFPLFDYLIVTSDSVGDGFKQLARHFRLIGAPFVIEIHEDENPIRVIYLAKGPVPRAQRRIRCHPGRAHFRAETENRATLAYVSYTHEPDDASEIERLLGCPVRSGASWAGLALPPQPGSSHFDEGIRFAPLSIGEVSHLIGYSEPAAFHRAFKRWYGMTPERFRERRRAQG